MNFTEEQLTTWASSPSQSERDKMDNAERAVRSAIAASAKLNKRNISVFPQGSYRNRVNVRQDSDVDIGVLCSDSFFWNGEQTSDSLDHLGYSDGTYPFSDFRREVGEALTSYFTGGVVTPGNKAFDIKSNSYRVEADVAPFFEHRRFDQSGNFISGVEMRSTTGARIINWPDQHYDNAVEKNLQSGRAFKGCVRILKTLRYRMIDDKIPSAKAATSFLMECLVWNVPNEDFNYSQWSHIIRAALAHLFNNTRDFASCSEWGEVSELKYLFRGGHPWTWQSAHSFVSDCWDYVGFDQ